MSESRASESEIRPYTVTVPAAAMETLSALCHARGASRRRLLSVLVTWFVWLERREQEIILGQLDENDALPFLLRSRGAFRVDESDVE